MIKERNRILVTMSCDLRLSTFLIFLCTINTATGLGSVLSTHYEHVNSGYTWEEAQNFCRRHHNDLATIYSREQANKIHLLKYKAWIGLHKETSSKQWVWTDGENQRVLWEWYEPGHNEDCAAITYYNYHSRRIYGENCGNHLFLVCQRNNTYHFINKTMNWSQAQQYCADHYGRLASFNWSGMHIFSMQDFPIWIGLHRNGVSWKWSSGLFDDMYWNFVQPSDDKNCVTISSTTKQLATENCQTRLPFLCNKDNMFLVKENKSWEEAFEHCRHHRLPYNSNLRFNLLSIQPGDEQTYVVNTIMEADSKEVWTGLRFLGDEWFWINGADMLYTDLQQCPILAQRCGALSKNGTGTLEARDCLERKNFLCYSYNP